MSTLTNQQTSEPTAASPRRLRFNIASLLWLFVTVALALMCFLQTRKVMEAERALARNAWAQQSTSIPAGKFRVMVNSIVDDAEQKIIVVRVETNDAQYIGADGARTFMEPTNNGMPRWGEVIILFSYDSTTGKLTELTRTKCRGGWAGGRSIGTLPPGAKPADHVKITIQPGLYDVGQPIELYKLGDQSVPLLVK
jgi:hypothetical protein